MKDSPKHELMNQFDTKNNELLVGGIPLTRLAARIGKTPFYAYDRHLIERNFEQLKRAIPPEIHLHYAIKANSMPAVVQHLAKLTNGLDVASMGELKIALDTGINPSKVSFAGPGKDPKELSSAIAAGVIINIESERELENVVDIGQRLSIMPRVSVRINPDFELKTSGMKMSGGPKPFGIDAERVPGVLQRISDLDVDFQGFHIFSGSQNLRPEALIEAQTNTFDLAYRMSEFCKTPMKWLNIGGGFGIPYFPGEKRLDIAPISENLNGLVNEYRDKLPEAEVIIELGRYLVGEAGIYVCEVIDIKESRGETFVITNGGLHHHLAASGNFGQVIRKNYPVCIGNKIDDAATQTVNIVGPLCTPMDIIANKVELQKPEIGDLIVVYQSGAYGLNASPRGFLSHPEPAEVLV
ncbi:MAG: pyridoxal-dependent decarboxylase, exosortase A system-associated [Sedimenticola sp.]